jgi:hypothetical protein
MYFTELDCGKQLGDICGQVKESLELARLTKRIIKFEFNGCQIEVKAYNTEEGILRQYEDKLQYIKDTRKR